MNHSTHLLIANYIYFLFLYRVLAINLLLKASNSMEKKLNSSFDIKLMKKRKNIHGDWGI
jgi:hypothetical protein